MLNLPRTIPTLAGPATVDAIGTKALAAHAKQWRPHLKGEPDEAWDWATHARGLGTVHFGLPGEFLEPVALWSGDYLDKLMIVSGPHTCIHPSHAGAESVYIEFLASAPWHRRNLGLVHPQNANPPTAGVGACLVNEAIVFSRHKGWFGRLAWDSKASAVGSYDRMFARVCLGTPLRCGTDKGTGEVTMEIDANLANAWHYP